jgi:hypothetical protein
MDPALGVAEIITVPASHLLAPVTVVILGVIFIVAATCVRVALVHDALVTSAK